MMNVQGCWLPVSTALQRSVCVCVIIRFDSMVLLQLVSAGFLLPPRTSLSPKNMCALNSTKINDYALAEALESHPVGGSCVQLLELI